MSEINSELKFIGYNITKIDYQINREFSNKDKKVIINPEYKVNLGKANEDENIQLIRIDCNLFKRKPQDYPFRISVSIEGAFNTKSILDDNQEYIDNLLQYNGVAILLPYLRSVISQITALSGIAPVNLPLINVNYLYSHDADEESEI